MPTPSRTSFDEIVAAGRILIEASGPEGLNMQEVARMVGVRAPSLYKHVAGRDMLIRRVAEQVVGDLASVLEGAVTGSDPSRDLIALANEFRRFAHANPGAYRLLFRPMPAEWRPDSLLLTAAAAPVVRTASALVGTEHSLEAARTVTAWAHGFVSMELSGAFRMGGDVEAAFGFGLETLSRALTER